MSNETSEKATLLGQLPEALRQLRIKAGLSQRAAAMQIRERTDAGVTQAMISQWERGEQRPSLDSLDALLVGLGWSLADLHHALTEVEPAGERDETASDPVDALLALVNRQNTVDPDLQTRLRALLDIVDIGGLPSKLQEVTHKVGRLERLMRAELETIERRVRQLRRDFEASPEPESRRGRPPRSARTEDED